SDNPPQVKLLEKIDQLHDKWLKQVGEPAIAKRREVNKSIISSEHLQAILETEVGKNILDNLHVALAQLETNLRAKNDLENIILVIKISKNMVEQETGKQSFIITGKDDFLEPYHTGYEQLKINLTTLRSQLTDDDDLVLMEQIESFSTQWTEQAAKPEIAARHEININSITMSDTIKVIQSGIGKNILDAMRVQFDNFIQTENQLNIKRSNAAKYNVYFINNLALWLTIISIIIGVWLSISISRSITRPLKKLTIMANNMAVGNMQQINNLQEENITIRQDEMGDIGRSYEAMVNYFNTIIEDIVQISQGMADGNLRSIPKANYQGNFIRIKNSMEVALSSLNKVVKDNVQVAQGLATGNLRVTPKAEYKGDFIQIKNALETVLLAQSQVIEDIVQVAQGLADGSKNVVSKADYQGDFIQIKTALEAAASKLSETMAQNTIQNWLKTGQTELSKQISGEQDIITLAKNVCTFLTTYLEAQVGAFYIVEEETRIKLFASYAYNQRKGLPNEFQLGEGLVGQAVLEKQKILVTDVPENYISIQSGTGEAVPKNILVMPFMYENNVKGAIEIASFHEFTPTQLELLEQVMPNIGITINTAESRTKMQVLLQSES
ncbi:MAG: CHASE3 domain-containing protein, partial [Candidatus Marithrix sp.]|nr:CHASE3 domain-containing protein [Candidatus Marithrix sp.]